MNPTSTPNSDPNGQVPNGTDPTGQVPTPQGQVPSGQPQGNVPIDNLPQSWQDHIKKLRENEASARVELNKLNAEKKQQEEAAKAKEQQELQEQNKHKELSDIRQSEIDKLKAEIAQRDSEIAKRDYEALKAKVATKHGLAPELAMRLVGTTEDELDKDAAALKKITGESQKGAPGNGPNPRPAGAPSIEQREKEDFERLRRSGRYGHIA
jgi:hypothetical protein